MIFYSMQRYKNQWPVMKLFAGSFRCNQKPRYRMIYRPDFLGWLVQKRDGEYCLIKKP